MAVTTVYVRSGDSFLFFCKTYAEEQEAKDFVSLNEKEFVLNPQNFSVDRLYFKKKQEFKRRKK